MNSRALPTAHLVAVGVAIVAYAAINPLRLEHWTMLGALACLAWWSRRTRQLALTLVPVVIFAWVYDLLRLFRPRSFKQVTVEWIYDAELALFGWMHPDGPVEAFRQTHWFAVDLVGGAWYSTHILTAIGFAVFLWWRIGRSSDPQDFRCWRNYIWGFLALNVAGFVTQAAWPVAPPWYVEAFGLQTPASCVIGDPAALTRVDAWLGYPHFASIYQSSTYVFGAMPSLHVACPTWLALYQRGSTASWAAAIYAGLMAFFAVYLGHHYLIDVVAGIGFAYATYLVVESERGSEVVAWIHAQAARVLGAGGGRGSA